MHIGQARPISRLQREADATITDLEVGVAPDSLADLGCSGRYPANIERDMHRWARRELNIKVEPLIMKLPMLNANRDTEPKWFGILLPHELFAEMVSTPGDRGYDCLLGSPGTP